MNTSFEKVTNSTDEWYTPPCIFEPLGSFDLDPCAPVNPLWKIGKTNYTQLDDGLCKQWTGRVWLNPPYSRPLIERFVGKLADHGNGMALLFNRCDSKLFHDIIFPKADAILFLRGRIKFYTADGRQGGTPGCGSVLIAFGAENARILETCGIPGQFFRIDHKQTSGASDTL